MSSQRPKPPLAGIAYGETAFWIAVIGLLVTVVGLGMAVSGSEYVRFADVVDNWEKGDTVHEFWEYVREDSGREASGYWFFDKLTYGDAVSMLGISITSIAALAGIFCAFGVFLSSRNRDFTYAGFSLIIAIIILLAALGIVAAH